ncbi:hypothetical protein FACS189491_05550 [Spirochaetia bacterium]|nr:hypothetical protein FACS189491_05550 [Spirochaetia bacterium]
MSKGKMGTEKGSTIVYDVIRNYDTIYAYTASLRDFNEESIQSEKMKHNDGAWYWIWYSDMEFNKINYRARESPYSMRGLGLILVEYEYYIFRDYRTTRPRSP